MPTLFPLRLLWEVGIRVLSLSTGEWRVGGMFGPFKFVMVVSLAHGFDDDQV